MKRKKKFIIAAGIAAACVISGVLASWTQEILTHNEFQTAVYDTVIKEEFKSPDHWLPGVEVNKDAWVQNNSSIPVFVKVKIRQSWAKQDGSLPLYFSSGDSKEAAALVSWGSDVDRLSDIDSIAEAEGKWLICNDTPDENGEIEAFYIGALAPGKETPKLVDGVTMNPLIQASVVRKDTRYNSVTGKWETVTTESGQPDYGDARYTMTVTAETVQATSDAMRDMFGSGNEKIYQQLDQYVISGENHSAKKLSFEKKNGKMTWSSKRESGENWFMSFTDMVPGVKYTDKLDISNKSGRTYDLYMQFLPKEQSEKLDELLEHITMKVTQGGRTIYEGTAAGKAYQNGSIDLRDVLKLCRLKPGDASDLKIYLELDPELSAEYADLLTKIDCRFMVTEINKPLKPIHTPKTGDMIPIAAMVLTLLSLTGVFLFSRKKRKEQQ